MGRSDEELLAQLGDVLAALSDRQLASIGVTIERQDDTWLWLRDALIEALRSTGRHRAANRLTEHDLHFQPYSIGLSVPLLRALVPLIAKHYAEEDPNDQ